MGKRTLTDVSVSWNRPRLGRVAKNATHDGKHRKAPKAERTTACRIRKGNRPAETTNQKGIPPFEKRNLEDAVNFVREFYPDAIFEWPQGGLCSISEYFRGPEVSRRSLHPWRAWINAANKIRKNLHRRTAAKVAARTQPKSRARRPIRQPAKAA